MLVVHSPDPFLGLPRRPLYGRALAQGLCQHALCYGTLCDVSAPPPICFLQQHPRAAITPAGTSTSHLMVGCIHETARQEICALDRE